MFKSPTFVFWKSHFKTLVSTPGEKKMMTIRKCSMKKHEYSIVMFETRTCCKSLEMYLLSRRFTSSFLAIPDKFKNVLKDPSAKRLLEKVELFRIVAFVGDTSCTIMLRSIKLYRSFWLRRYPREQANANPCTCVRDGKPG